MEVKIVQKPSFRVTGMTCTTTLKETRENNTIPKLMDEFFGNHVHEIQHIKQPVQSYGISIDPPSYDPNTDEFQWIAGVEVDAEQEISGMITREFPENTYAVVCYRGHLRDLWRAYDYFYEEWLPYSEYKLADTYSFEYMDERFKGAEAEENVVDLYFPIQPK